jgi:hypothetical protein
MAAKKYKHQMLVAVPLGVGIYGHLSAFVGKKL